MTRAGLAWTYSRFFCSALLCWTTGFAADSPPEVTYNRHIRPVLSDKCFLCHGPDQRTRKAELRLDQLDSALEKKAIVPGKPDESELVKRIFASQPDRVMPPPETHKTLTAAEKENLRTWIAQGAKYETHWAYMPPKKPEVPAGKNRVDFLVQQRLQALGLSPSAEADRRTLARRLHFDLIGLPPKPEESNAFLSDNSADAYSNLVERLLSSPHYGERMAIGWLDVARFADSIGYHSDNPRNIWPYRDYVIRAFNENRPFDRFTAEQLAGDLLPEATREQKVASALNRLLLSTEEGGAQPKDYEYRMLTDRVRAVGTVWLGQTFGCAACHDHKFDPITMRDFYSLGAFFADIKEPIIGAREPGMLVPDETQETELKRLEGEVTRLQREFEAPHPDLNAAFAQWLKVQEETHEREKLWTVLLPTAMASAQGAHWVAQSEGSILVKDHKPDRDTYKLTFTNAPSQLAGIRIEALPHDSLPSKGPGRATNGNFTITEVTAQVKNPAGQQRRIKLKSARASFEQATDEDTNPRKLGSASAVVDDDVNGDSLGWAILPKAGQANQILLELSEPAALSAGELLIIEILQHRGQGSHTLGHFRVSGCSAPEALTNRFSFPLEGELAKLAAIPPDLRTEDQKRQLASKFKSVAPELAALRGKITDAKKALADYETNVARCLVTISTPERRAVHILPRGDFLNEEKGEKVEPALPAYLPGARVSTKEERLTRLDLANWLISRENPLMARVTMNRLWKQFFGAGLSKVLDDLGAQGELPPNQPLLDWLACEFMDSGWDIKHMVRLIVNSHTYKQVSTQTAELRAKDPYNRELACQSRWRLEAELVRDNALSISGLLVPSIGGPSVKPYQPEGYWENLNFSPRTYDNSKGEDQYRRGLYSWWQRSYLHPAMLAFDAPSREECAAERIRSNIPQQALVLLNDPSFVEASRAFAIRIVTEGGKEAGARITWGWRQALGRDPEPGEMEVLLKLLGKLETDYTRDKAAARAFLKVGLQPLPTSINEAELAAWSHIARVILNLHETITRS